MFSSPGAGLGFIFSGKVIGLYYTGDALNFKTWHHIQFYKRKKTKRLFPFILIQTFSLWRCPSCHKTQQGKPRRHGWVYAVEAGRAGTGWESSGELLESPPKQKAWSRDQAAGVHSWARWYSVLWGEKGVPHLQETCHLEQHFLASGRNY